MNHPTMDDLMRVEDSIEVNVRGKKRKFYLRTLGQRDEDARRDHAVSASRAMYRGLSDEKSEDYLRYIAPLAESSRVDQENNLAQLILSELRKEAELEIVVPDTPEAGEHPSVTDVVVAEEARDTAEKDTESARRERVQTRLAEYREEVKTWDSAKVLAELIRLTRDAVVADAFGRAFNDGCVFWGTWKDAKYRVRCFSNMEDAQNCASELYGALLTGYYELDRFSADADGLKNSPSDQPPST
jgi:hypothetical protein